MKQFCFQFLMFQHFRLPENEVRHLKQVHDACQADRRTYCDESILKRLVDNQNDKQVGIHMLCMAERAGLMRNGYLNNEVIRTKVSLGAKERSTVDGLVRKCAQSQGNPEATAVQLWICFVQNDIHYYHRL